MKRIATCIIAMLSVYNGALAGVKQRCPVQEK